MVPELFSKGNTDTSIRVVINKEQIGSALVQPLFVISVGDKKIIYFQKCNDNNKR